MTPDLIYDQLIGTGCARKLVFSWGGNPGVGSLHRFRDAIERAGRVRLKSKSTPRGDGERLRSGRLWAAVRRAPRLSRVGYSELQSALKFIDCPFTGERLAAVPAIRPTLP